MKIRTDDDIEIFCLPDCAVCTISGKHPDNMQKCPMCLFDILGMECIPDACEFYEENWEDEKEKKHEAFICR